MAEKGLNPEMRSELTQLWQGAIHWDVAMGDYCTFKTGGKVEALLSVSTRDELVTLIRWLEAKDVSWRVIGRGSNILVQSKGYRGVVITLGGAFNNVEKAADLRVQGQQMYVRVGAGCPVGHFVGWCCENEVSGAEFLVGIPGSIGGAVHMNAGAWGKEISDCIKSVTFIDSKGTIHEVHHNELQFSYRQLKYPGEFGEEPIIIEAVLKLTRGLEKDILAKCREYMEKRRDKQPLGVASAGSFFKNPPGDSAGRLIDAAGLKGLCKGNAMVSTTHANFIVNTGQASPDDIVELMQEIQQKVYNHSGVRLEPEVHLL